jgi:hypothetical protein
MAPLVYSLQQKHLASAGNRARVSLAQSLYATTTPSKPQVSFQSVYKRVLRPVLKSFNVDVNPFIVELYVIKFDDKPV